MINLTTITSKIKLQTSSTAGIDVSTSWADYNGTNVTPSGLVTKITTATTTDIVGVPGASTTRNVKGIFVTNIHASTSNTVTITHFDGTNSVEIWGGILLAGESLEYVDTQGFIKYSANGVQNGGTDGTNGTNGTTLFTGSGVIDFGSGNDTASAVITDAGITTASKITISPYFNTTLALGRDVEEMLIDPISLVAVAGTGNFTVYASAVNGTVVGKYGLSYTST